MTGQDKKLTIQEVLGKLEIWFLNPYNDSNYIEAYKQHFKNKDKTAVLDIITKRALKIGLDPALVKEFREQSALYQEDKEKDKQETSKNTDNKELANTQGLKFDLDYLVSVELRDGKFYFITTSLQGGSIEKLLFNAPLEILALHKQGDIFKIRYTFDKEERVDTIDSMLSFIMGKLRLDRGKMQWFAQFIYLYKTKMLELGIFETSHEPVDVDKDGVIIVNQTIEQSTSEIMAILSAIYKISTNPESLLTTLCYSMVAPFSYDIRGKGEKFPYRMNAGKTHGGKTSDFELVMRGFNVNVKDYKETINTVKTAFTLGQKVEKSRLPFVIDDINNQWLEYLSEILKGATDGVKFMSRGTRDQSQIVYEMLSMPMMTMNSQPNIPLALNDRIILSLYSEKHTARQNKEEYERLAQMLKPGFMFNLINETLAGKNVKDILQSVHYSVKKDSEINQKLIDYSYSLLKGIADKVGIAWPERPILDKGNEVNILDTLVDYVAMRRQSAEGQYTRDATVDQKFELYIHGSIQESDEIRVTLPGYNDFIKEFRLYKYQTMQDFVNEVNDPKVKINTKYIKTLGKVAKCIVIPYDMVKQADPESLTLTN